MRDSTVILYKCALQKWHKGTGGGSGLATDFEGLNVARLEKYAIELNTFDHTDVASIPALLINGYCKQMIPYLTLIHLWDKFSDYLHSSRHDSLNI